MDYEVIISGGGLNGITLALALNHAGISVAIIDKQARETFSTSKITARECFLCLFVNYSYAYSSMI